MGPWDYARAGLTVVNPAAGIHSFAPEIGGYVKDNFKSVRDNPIANALLGKPPGDQPGVGGAAKDPSQLHQDPSTGLFFDPTTGTSYTDHTGTTPVTDPNMAQQVAANYAQSRAFLSRLANVQGQQQGVVSGLQRLLRGEGTSLAQMQAQQQAQQGAAQQMSQAAGIGGAASPLARLLAMRNSGAIDIGANNAGTMGRAAEEQNARSTLASLLTNMAGQNLGGAQAFGGMASEGQAGIQGMNNATARGNQDFNLKFASAIQKGVGSAMGVPGMGGAGAGGGGMDPDAALPIG